MANSLRIAEWNANGIIQKKTEIEMFLKLHNIDILLVSESHFTDRSFIKIPHYNIYHAQHPDGTAHGGSAIIIRSSIVHHELPAYQTDFLQATIIQVKKLPAPINVSAIYCPPRHNFTKQMLQPFFDSMGQKFIIGGDFNAKHTHWGSRLTTTKGRELYKVLIDNNYNFLSTGSPTYWPTDQNKIPDLLDLFITKGLGTSYMNIISNYDIMSDHSPIIATISSTIIYKEPTATLSNKKTNWDLFQHHIEQHLNINISLKTTDEIEQATNLFITTIQSAGWRSTPQPTNSKINSPNIPYEIMEIVKEKRRARARWQRTHNIEDKRKFNQLNNKLRNKLKQTRNETFQEYIKTLSTHDQSIWKVTKSTKRPKTHIPPLRDQGGNWLRSNKEKADAFAHHLAEVFKPNSNEINQEVEDELQTPLQMALPIQKFTIAEIENEIKMLNNKKSPGQDLITPIILKQLPEQGIKFLRNLFNGILRLTYWPLQLKFAQIILIPKPGKPPNDIQSYRPISLLSVISKLLEKLLLRRINENSLQDEWLPNHQFGFRHYHSTIQQCHRITNSIQTALQSKLFCSAVMLDVRQAFDRVWHRGLLYKIKKTMPYEFYLIFHSYLTNRSFQTKIGNDVSQIEQINAGVPQGSVLGPMLYLLFTSDLPTSNDTMISTFADDTAILACNNDPNTASEMLQAHLNQIEIWLDKWRIKVNKDKSAHITFTTKRPTCPPVTLNNIPIPQSKEVKYLGLHLDRRLTWKTHISKKRKEMDIKIKKLYWLIGRKSPLTLENKTLLYKSIIRPIWTYGCQLWGCARNSNLDIIQRFQSKTLRNMANAPWFVSNRTIHADLNIPYVKDIIKQYAIKHQNTLESHPNETMEPLTADPHNRRLQMKWPKDLTN